MNLKTQTYWVFASGDVIEIPLKLIDRNYENKKAFRFTINGTNQNIWIPKKHCTEDGTIRPGEDLAYVFRSAARQLEYAGFTMAIPGIKSANIIEKETRLKLYGYSLGDVRKRVKMMASGKSTFKPVYGRGTGAGELNCPLCYCCIGSIVVRPNLDDLESSKLIGWLSPFSHHMKDCENAGKFCDISETKVSDLLINVIPSEITEEEYDAYIIANKNREVKDD